MKASRENVLSVIRKIQNADFLNESERDKMLDFLEKETGDDYICEYIHEKRYEGLSAEEILELALKNQAKFSNDPV